MKAYTLLILLAVFQVLFCKIEGLTEAKLQEAFTKAQPFIKTFQQQSFPIPKNTRFNKVSLQVGVLNKNNTKFKIDEHNILHVSFVNLNAKMTGQFKYNQALKSSPFASFTANLTNMTYTEQYMVNVTKAKTGKSVFKFKKMGQNHLDFKVKKVEFSNFKEEKKGTKTLAVKAASAGIKNLNYKGFLGHLHKILNLILDTFAKEAQK